MWKSLPTVWHALRHGTWLTRQRVRGYATVLLLVELAVFGFCVAGTHGLIVRLAQPTSTDFVSFYAAGRLADAGTPELAYDQAAHYAAEQAATEPGISYNYFYYPPVFLLLCGWLARLPYLLAFVSFQIATLVPCLLVARAILRQRDWAAMAPLLAFPAVLWTLGTGQNALLTAAVFGAATLLTERRPVLAGVLFGMLCYKPHFALLVPVAMLAGAHWRALLAAAASALGLVALSGVALGWHTWQAFLHAAAGARAVYGAGHIDVAGLASPYGAVLSLGGRPELASAVQAVAMLAAAGGVWLVWRRHASLPVRAAVLLAATPVAVPIVMFYDLMLSGLAMLWLVRAGRERGFLPWQQLAMVVLFLLPLRSGNLGASTQLLIAPVCAAGVLALALVCARAELSGARGMRRLPARSKQAIFTAEALRIFGCYAKRPKG